MSKDSGIFVDLRADTHPGTVLENLLAMAEAMSPTEKPGVLKSDISPRPVDHGIFYFVLSLDPSGKFVELTTADAAELGQTRHLTLSEMGQAVRDNVRDKGQIALRYGGLIVNFSNRAIAEVQPAELVIGSERVMRAVLDTHFQGYNTSLPPRF